MVLAIFEERPTRPVPTSLAAALVGAVALAVLAPSASAQAGGLDSSFGGDGKVRTDFSDRADAATSIAVQTNGKIVVAGISGDGSSNPKFALARYNTDGSLDATFGGDGEVRTDFTTRYDGAWGVAIDSTGKIVAAGDAGLGSGNSKFAVARYNSDGSLDTSFGGDGKVTTQFTSRDDPVAGLTIAAGDKILVSGGAAFTGSNPKFAVARYNTNGSLDETFGGDGRVTTDLTAGRDYANAVAVQTDGKILAAGLGSPSQGRASFALVRYRDTGALDTTFSRDGKVLTNFTSWNDSGQNIAIQPTDEIVVAGIAGSGGADPAFALVRYTPAGRLDATFGGDGKVKTQFTGGYDAAYDLALQADGKIVAGGEAAGSGVRFAAARYGSDGALDTTFGGDGRVTTDFTAQADFALAVALDLNGKLVLAGGAGWGGSNPKVGLARYLTM